MVTVRSKSPARSTSKDSVPKKLDGRRRKRADSVDKSKDDTSGKHTDKHAEKEDVAITPKPPIFGWFLSLLVIVIIVNTEVIPGLHWILLSGITEILTAIVFFVVTCIGIHQPKIQKAIEYFQNPFMSSLHDLGVFEWLDKLPPRVSLADIQQFFLNLLLNFMKDEPVDFWLKCIIHMLYLLALLMYYGKITSLTCSFKDTTHHFVDTDDIREIKRYTKYTTYDVPIALDYLSFLSSVGSVMYVVSIVHFRGSVIVRALFCMYLYWEVAYRQGRTCGTYGVEALNMTSAVAREHPTIVYL